MGPQFIGTHCRQHPRPVKSTEVKDVPGSRVVEALGPAGTAFMFDTSGIQGVPMLEERHAVFLNYHDPDVPLQREDFGLLINGSSGFSVGSRGCKDGSSSISPGGLGPCAMSNS